MAMICFISAIVTNRPIWISWMHPHTDNTLNRLAFYETHLKSSDDSMTGNALKIHDS